MTESARTESKIGDSIVLGNVESGTVLTREMIEEMWRKREGELKGITFKVELVKDYEKSRLKNLIADALFYAGSRWDKAPTPDELLSALDAAGLMIVEKPNSAAE